MLPKMSAHAEDIWPQRATAAAELLDRQWGKPDGWSASENWQRFPIVDSLIALRARTGDTRWDGRIAAAVRNRTGLILNDDALWAVIASVDAWQVDRDPELLAFASNTYGKIVGQFWDDACGGGLWWDPARTYKNAITNELLLAASTRLYRATGQQAYLDWALRSWNWFAASGMMTADGLVNDGLGIDRASGSCANNGAPRFTYNQGVLLAGLSDLTTITGDPQYRAQATRTALAATRTLVTPDGLLTEPFDQLGRDGPMFKGVFARNLGELIATLPEGPDRTELQAWLQRNAQAVWRLTADGAQPIDGLWSGGSGQVGAAAQAAGVDVLVGAQEPAG